MLDLKDPKTIERWAAGKAKPRPSRLVRMQETFLAARLIDDEYGPRVTRSWFIGSNALRAGRSPASRIRDAEFVQEDVVSAARAFVDG